MSPRGNTRGKHQLVLLCWGTQKKHGGRFFSPEVLSNTLGTLGRPMSFIHLSLSFPSNTPNKIRHNSAHNQPFLLLMEQILLTTRSWEFMPLFTSLLHPIRWLGMGISEPSTVPWTYHPMTIGKPLPGLGVSLQMTILSTSQGIRT